MRRSPTQERPWPRPHPRADEAGQAADRPLPAAPRHERRGATRGAPVCLAPSFRVLPWPTELPHLQAFTRHHETRVDKPICFASRRSPVRSRLAPLEKCLQAVTFTAQRSLPRATEAACPRLWCPLVPNDRACTSLDGSVLTATTTDVPLDEAQPAKGSRWQRGESWRQDPQSSRAGRTISWLAIGTSFDGPYLAASDLPYLLRSRF